MKLPSSLRLKITISNCTGLRKLELRDFENGERLRDDALEKERYARDKFREIAGSATEYQDSENLIKRIGLALDQINIARAKVAAFPDKPAKPNAFVIVRLSRPGVAPSRDPGSIIGRTEVVRRHCSPIWREKICELQLATMAECFEGRDESGIYPEHVLFEVWHDDGQHIDGVPNFDDADANWNRVAPRPSVLLAYAKWSFRDIVSRIGKEEQCHSLQLKDARGQVQENSKLEISTLVTANWGLLSKWYALCTSSTCCKRCPKKNRC